ncbi:hypothetical protein [Capnocytophaga granulosa]|uniref:hypothetical protein n=1 Tax=Capnocytophaga granulosa TaxID=45242 RepID=UPI0038575578
MKIGDKVRVSPFIPKDPANQKGKVGVIVEIVNNEGLEIVKVRFSNDCYGLYDSDTLEKINYEKVSNKEILQG